MRSRIERDACVVRARARSSVRVRTRVIKYSCIIVTQSRERREDSESRESYNFVRAFALPDRVPVTRQLYGFPLIRNTFLATEDLILSPRPRPDLPPFAFPQRLPLSLYLRSSFLFCRLWVVASSGTASFIEAAASAASPPRNAPDNSQQRPGRKQETRAPLRVRTAGRLKYCTPKDSTNFHIYIFFVLETPTVDERGGRSRAIPSKLNFLVPFPISVEVSLPKTTALDCNGRVILKDRF